MRGVKKVKKVCSLTRELPVSGLVLYRKVSVYFDLAKKEVFGIVSRNYGAADMFENCIFVKSYLHPTSMQEINADVEDRIQCYNRDCLGIIK